MTDREEIPDCDRCHTAARWSVCNLEGISMDPIVRWFACGRHLHTVLTEADWELDCVQVYDFQRGAEAPLGT
jgi:hypothetical protein